ncbi:MAG: glycosyltransferase [Desulfitobacteriaceae bacterium]
MKTCCVILNYNDSKTTISLLASIKDYNELNYIVVVDNKSSDDSYAILKNYEDEKIHVLLSERNGGYGYGNNLGIRYSYEILAAEYILIANPDVYFSSECVQKLRQVLIDKKECAISAAVPLEPNGERQKVIAWKLPTVKQEILGASVLLTKILSSKIVYDHKYFKGKSTCYVDVVQGAMLMVNANVMVNYGMYDEDFFLYGEEQVLANKLKKNGYKSILLLNQYYVHQHSASINKIYKSLVTKKRLILHSKLLYLKKYNNLGFVKFYFAVLFFKLLLAEMWLISIIKNIQTEGHV